MGGGCRDAGGEILEPTLGVTAMTDYAAEQADELEALESIFPDELEVLEPNNFQIRVAAEVDEFEGRNFNVSFLLNFTYPEEYPDVVPIVALREVKGLDEAQMDALRVVLASEAEDNIGMPVVFTLQSFALEWTEDKAAHNLEYAQNEKSRKEEAEREAEIAKLTAGTAVTKESFAEWRANFEAEIASSAAAATTSRRTSKGKISGRKMFETNKKMATSEDSQISTDDVVVDTDAFSGMDLGDLDAELGEDD